MNVPKIRFEKYNDEWKKIKLGDYCNLITKGTTPNKFTDSGIRFIKIESLNNMSIDNNDCLFISELVHNTILKRSILEDEDVLFAIAGATIGKCGIVRKNNLPANTNQALAILRLKKEKLNPYFLLNILDSYVMKKYIYLNIAVGAQPNLNLEQMNNFSFNIPTKEEQDKIVNVLNLLNKKIELQTKKIEDLKLFKLCMMKEIFTSNSASNLTKIKDIAIIEKGKQINGDLLLEYGNYYMLNGGINPSGYLNEYNRNENTITISEGGNSCGYVNINKEKFWCGGHCYSAAPNNINNDYLYQILKYNEKAIMELRVGSGLPNIQKKDIENFNLKIHNKEEQENIALKLSKFDYKITLEEKYLSKLHDLKKGLMQNMFV